MEDISWMEEDIVECTPTIPFSSTSNVGIVGFVNPQKVVAQRNAFPIFGNAQNEDVSKVRTKNFGHGGLKHSFSQVEGDLDLQKILKLASLPKKKATIITMKEEDEEGEKVGKKKIPFKGGYMGQIVHLNVVYTFLFFMDSNCLHQKFNAIYKQYKDDKIADEISGNDRHECPFYDALDIWWH